MILSKKCVYGLRAMLYLGIQPTGRDYVPIGETAQKLGIPSHFLAKIFQELRAKGLLATSRGGAGGVRLALPPEQITVRDVVEILEGADFYSSCFLGFASCDDSRPCALHHRWNQIRDQLQDVLSGENLRDLGVKIQQQDLRLREDSLDFFDLNNRQ